jgi:hypothetical protein
MIESGEHRYIVPVLKGSPLIINLAEIAKAEARLVDVQSVTKHKAPELLVVFNNSIAELRKVYIKLRHETDRAEMAYKQAEATALLDVTDEKIRARGHSKASADLRKAMASLDESVTAAADRFFEIRALRDFILSKIESFDNAYTSVKKIFSDVPNGSPGTVPLHNHTGGNYPPGIIEDTFGQVKY